MVAKVFQLILNAACNAVFCFKILKQSLLKGNEEQEFRSFILNTA